MGEDLDPLSLKELQNLEHQLDSALKRIRTRKNQLMHESISELQKKEKSLHEHNKSLAKKIKEDKTVPGNEEWQQANQGNQGSSTFMIAPQPPPQPPLPPPSVQFPSSNGTFQIGSRALDEETVALTHAMSSTLMPMWMLRQVNE